MQLPLHRLVPLDVAPVPVGPAARPTGIGTVVDAGSTSRTPVPSITIVWWKGSWLSIHSAVASTGTSTAEGKVDHRVSIATPPWHEDARQGEQRREHRQGCDQVPPDHLVGDPHIGARARDATGVPVTRPTR